MTSVAVGQLLLALLAPLSRASSDGVLTDGIALLAPDSLTYLDLAADPAWLDRTPWNRLLLVALLRGGTALGTTTFHLVLFQAMTLAVAAALAHDIAVRRGGPTAGVVAAAIVAVNPLTAQWVRFILTETIMLSLVVITLWLADRMVTSAAGPRIIALLLTTASAATFLRPNGILVLGGVLTILLGRVPRMRRALALALVWAAVAGGLLLGLEAAGQPAERPLTAQLHAGVVVEGTDDVLMTIAMPTPDEPEDVSTAAGLRYVVSEPLPVARLGMIRILVEVAQVRRHYPVPVNIAVGIAMALLLYATIIGLRTSGARSLARTSAALGVPILLLVGATFATPEGRYGWGALVLTAPLAGIGAARVLERASAGVRQLMDGPGTDR